jgi:hypothetical protein
VTWARHKETGWHIICKMCNESLDGPHVAKNVPFSRLWDVCHMSLENLVLDLYKFC